MASGSADIRFALIGDVVGSRGLKDRAAAQRTLQATVAALNRSRKDGGCRDGMAAALKLTAGDEVQTLLLDPAFAVDIVVRIADALHPAVVVWGLGAGPLSTDEHADVAVLDGPCFHRARAAVEAAARDRVWVRAAGFAEPHQEALSSLFRLMGAVRSRWKPAQMRYIRGARGQLQQEVAEQHGVDESTVSKALHAARFRDVETAEAAARALLAWMRGRPGPDALEAEV
jgi:hypothetical protein